MLNESELININEDSEEEFSEIFQEEENSNFMLDALINWMRSLSILLNHEDFQTSKLIGFYSTVSRRETIKESDNTVLSNIFLAINFLSALEVFRTIPDKANDLIRIAIINWYYGLFYSAKAMLTATDNSMIDNHAGLARHWDTLIALKALAPRPLSFRASSLVKKQSAEEINLLEGQFGKAVLHELYPRNINDAYKVYINYLKGCTKFYRELREKQIKKDNRLESFHTNQSQGIRDKILKNHTCSFLHMAYRYRGRVNYRGAIFLGYGAGTYDFKLYFDDLYNTLKIFLLLTSVYCSKRIEENSWKLFIDNLKIKSNLSINTDFLHF